MPAPSWRERLAREHKQNWEYIKVSDTKICACTFESTFRKTKHNF